MLHPLSLEDRVRGKILLRKPKAPRNRVIELKHPAGQGSRFLSAHPIGQSH
jgi:hypothetical protein